MSEYIDLAGDIASTYRIDRGVTDYVLHALDRFIADHPDQVPGRTITQSALHDVQAHNGFSGTDRRFRNVMRDLGITVIPDPEPTNAEKLEKALGEYGVGRGVSTSGLAEYLDAAGVKAPGGDDE